MKGLDDANQALMDTILDSIAPLDQIPPPQLARRSSPVSVVDIAESKLKIKFKCYSSCLSLLCLAERRNTRPGRARRIA